MRKQAQAHAFAPTNMFYEPNKELRNLKKIQDYLDCINISAQFTCLTNLSKNGRCAMTSGMHEPFNFGQNARSSCFNKSCPPPMSMGITTGERILAKNFHRYIIMHWMRKKGLNCENSLCKQSRKLHKSRQPLHKYDGMRWWEFDGKISSLLILIRGKPLPRAILEASLLAHKRNVFNEAIIGQVNVLPFVVMH